jgi:Protein of unknown function (DUF3551)
MRHRTHCGIILAAALSAVSATGARADQWCGYATHDNAVIECGYTTADQCESAVGKGGMCFVDPDLALDTKRMTPAVPAAFSAKIPARG